MVHIQHYFPRHGQSLNLVAYKLYYNGLIGFLKLLTLSAEFFTKIRQNEK
jgi:hypothetical protein